MLVMFDFVKKKKKKRRGGGGGGRMFVMFDFVRGEGGDCEEVL